jgi:hypothetical protein
MADFDYDLDEIVTWGGAGPEMPRGSATIYGITSRTAASFSFSFEIEEKTRPPSAAMTLRLLLAKFPERPATLRAARKNKAPGRTGRDWAQVGQPSLLAGGRAWSFERKSGFRCNMYFHGVLLVGVPVRHLIHRPGTHPGSRPGCPRTNRPPPPVRHSPGGQAGIKICSSLASAIFSMSRSCCVDVASTPSCGSGALRPLPAYQEGY